MLRSVSTEMSFLFLQAKSFPVYSSATFHLLILQLAHVDCGKHSLGLMYVWAPNLGRQNCFIFSMCCLSFQYLRLNLVGFHSVLSSSSSFCSLAWRASQRFFPLNQPKYYQGQTLLSLSSCALSPLPGREVQRAASQNPFHEWALQWHPLCRVTGTRDKHKRQYFTSDISEN